jgi:Sigma-70 region 2
MWTYERLSGRLAQCRLSINLSCGVCTRSTPGIFAYLARRVGRTLSEDLLAETFRVAMESYSAFDQRRGSEKMWLYGIATNLLRRHWRTEQRRLLALTRSEGRSVRTLIPSSLRSKVPLHGWTLNAKLPSSFGQLRRFSPRIEIS